MIQFYFGIGLSAIALVMAIFAIRDQLRNLRPVGLYDFRVDEKPAAVDAPNPYRLGFFFVVTIVAFIAPLPWHVVYKAGIGFSMLLLFLLELFAAAPGTPAIMRSGVNVPIYLVLWMTFASTTGWAFWSWWGLLALIPIGIGAALIWWLRKRVGYLLITVSIYAVNAALVPAFALTLVATHPAWWTLAALVGACFFVVPDIVLFLDRYHAEINRKRVWQMLFYFIATLALAWSTWSTF